MARLLDKSRFKNQPTLGGVKALADRVSAARDFVQTNGLPTRKQEDYKYTNLSFLKDIDLEWKEEATNSKSKFEFYCCIENSNFENKAKMPSGLELYSLSEFGSWPAEAKSEFEASFLQKEIIFEDAIDALNLSDCKHGIFIRVASNTEVKDPFHLLFTDEGFEGDNFLISNFKVFVSVGSSSQMTLFQESSSVKNVYRNVSLEASVQKNARLNHMTVQWDSDRSYSFFTTHINQERDSFVHNQTLSLGSKLSRNNVVSNINGENCDIELMGTYLTSGNQHNDHNTKINHNIGHSRSDQVYKGLLDDQSRAVMNGKVYIEKDAQKTDSSQLNKNLVLTEKAEVDTKPELEVYADDVKAAHGATVGQLDENEVFYFRSRAIDEKTANRMISEGFIKELAFRFPNQEVQNYVLNAIDQRVSTMNLGSAGE